MPFRRIPFGAQAVRVEVEYFPAGTKPLYAGRPIPWRIQLVSSGGDILGLDLYEDVILGRGDQAVDSAFVDLAAMRARDKGVSRQHAMLRPTPNRLYLIDLGSTNGTLLNSVPVGRGVAQRLQDGDRLMLGALDLTIHLVAAPTPPVW